MKRLTILLFASLLAIESAVAAEPLKLFVVTGGHDYHASFYRVFDDPDFHVNLRPHPGPFAGDLRKRVDVLVLYDMAPVKEIGEQGQKNLRDFLESGKGLVILHHAIFDYLDWGWYCKEVSGVRQDPNRDRSRPDYKHDVNLQIEPVAKHPVLSGIGPFQSVDETYRGLIIAPTNTILLRTNDPTSDGPVAWISPYKESRVIVVQLGHDEKAHLDANYQKLVRNAIRWAGGRLQ
jgi:type 1 glutamine amidotransferase